MTEPTNKDLKTFGWVFSSGLVIVFGLMIPWLLDSDYRLWPWIVATLIITTAMLSPRTLLPVYALWIKIGSVLGAVNSAVILTVIYWLIITPLGLIMRLIGRRPLLLKLDPSAQSYRTKVDQKTGKQDFKHPY